MPPEPRCRLLPFVLALAVLPTFPAEIDAADEVGVYFDGSAEENCISAEPYSTILAYLLLVEPSAQDAIAAWECAVEVENASLTAVELAGNGLDIDGSPDGFVVGLGTPVPSNTLVELAQLDVLVWGADPVGIYILANPTTGEGTPLYTVISDSGELLPMMPRTIGGDNLVAGINRPGCIPESATWGQVKRIYH